MAKKQTTPKTKTEQETTEDPELAKAEKAERERLKRPIGVYLRKDVRIAIEQIAEEEGLNRHALLSYAISYFVRQYKAGKAKIETEQTTRLKLHI